MEDKQLQLNEDNLSICCGINKEFHRIELACELQKKRQKNKFIICFNVKFELVLYEGYNFI